MTQPDGTDGKLEDVRLAPMELNEEEARELEEKFDSEMRFRKLSPATAWLVGSALVTLSLFHYYTAGFGLLHEMVHRGIHLSFVLALVFLVFPFWKSGYDRPATSTLLTPLGIPLYDENSGACRDALLRDHINQNQGAESTLAFHLSRAELSRRHRAPLPIS